jgi:hypothetical protein
LLPTIKDQSSSPPLLQVVAAEYDAVPTGKILACSRYMLGLVLGASSAVLSEVVAELASRGYVIVLLGPVVVAAVLRAGVRIAVVMLGWGLNEIVAVIAWMGIEADFARAFVAVEGLVVRYHSRMPR